MPLDTKLPTFGHFAIVSIPILRVDILVLYLHGSGVIPMPINNLI
jgi:hypothetical protein